LQPDGRPVSKPAIGVAARKRGVALTEVVIDGEMNLHLAERDDYFLGARLNIKLLGVDRAIAVQLVEDAKQPCPYSKATRGNIDVTINLL
jgi:osmotically inducible protein OsmC